jgi:hypothetical protein
MHTDNKVVSLSLYELLEIPSTATSEQIDTARGRSVALLTEEWTRETGVRQEHLDAAWVILRYPTTRESYDRVLATGHLPHPDLIVDRIKPDENGSIETSLNELAIDWPAAPTLPVNVSEVTSWNTAPDAGKYLPLVEMARHIAEEQAASDTRDGRKRQRHVTEALHAGHRPTRVPARIFAVIVGVAMLGVLSFGGFLMHKVLNKPMVGSVGACVKFAPGGGSVKQYVLCSKPNEGRIINVTTAASLCRSDTAVQAGTASRPLAYFWCIDYPKAVAAA